MQMQRQHIRAEIKWWPMLWKADPAPKRNENKANVQNTPDQTVDNAGLQTWPLCPDVSHRWRHTLSRSDRRAGASSKAHLKEHTATTLAPAPLQPPTLPIYIQRPSINLSLAQPCLWSTALTVALWRTPCSSTNIHERRTRDEMMWYNTRREDHTKDTRREWNETRRHDKKRWEETEIPMNWSHDLDGEECVAEDISRHMTKEKERERESEGMHSKCDEVWRMERETEVEEMKNARILRNPTSQRRTFGGKR